MKRRVLVVEDELSIRKLLTYDLKQSNFDVFTAEDALQALSITDSIEFDIILIDWMLPKLSGLEFVKKLRSKGNQAILMMLTAKDEETDILEAFEAGVDDYLTKPFSPRELTARMQAHLRRTSNHQHDVIVGNLTMVIKEHQVYVDHKLIPLTKKEYDLLHYLLINLNQVVSRNQILNEIWDFDYDGDTRIVDVHIFKLRKKLEKANLKIESLRGVGYVAKT